VDDRAGCGGEGGADDVLDIDVVEALVTVADNHGRLAGEEPFKVFHDDRLVTEIGVLTRSVCEEEAQTDSRQSVAYGEMVAEVFAGKLAGAVNGLRPGNLAFDEGRAVHPAISVEGGGEHDFADPGVA